MTKLSDSINSISPNTMPQRAKDMKSNDRGSNADNKIVNEPVKPKINFQNINQINKANFVAKVMNQSISSHFSLSLSKSFSNASITESPLKTNHNLADIDLAQADAENVEPLFDFEEVAKNVMAFVGGAIHAAQSRNVGYEQLEELFKQARSGVKQGVGEAIDILKSTGGLTKEIESGIDKSVNLINNKLDELHQQIFSPSEVSNTTSVTNQQSVLTAQSSNLSIITAEGDKVTISFNASQSGNAFEQYSSGERSNSYAVKQSYYSEQHFSYSVEGELNNAEKEALNDLIKQVDNVQRDFFNGDIEKAFNKAQELNYEPSQIASFNVDLKQQSTISQKYTQIANNENEAQDEKRKLVEQQLKPAIDFISQFEQLQQKTEKLLSTQGDQIGKFYDAVIKANGGDNISNKINRWHNIIDKI